MISRDVCAEFRFRQGIEPQAANHLGGPSRAGLRHRGCITGVPLGTETGIDMEGDVGVRNKILAAGAIAAVSAALVGSSIGAPKPTGPKPAPGWMAPVLVSADQAHRETSLAINPRNEKVMLACAPSGVPNTQGNQSYFHVSRSGGLTWEPVRVENDDANDPRTYTFEGGDCDVAFDEGGTMYVADTWLGNLSVGHSRDNGGT